MTLTRAAGHYLCAFRVIQIRRTITESFPGICLVCLVYVCVCREGERGRGPIRGLMTVFCNVHHDCLLPAEQEVTHAGSQRHGYAQVAVVGHEHQHEEVTDHHLDDVKYRLENVCHTQHPLPERNREEKCLLLLIIYYYNKKHDTRRVLDH